MKILSKVREAYEIWKQEPRVTLFMKKVLQVIVERMNEQKYMDIVANNGKHINQNYLIYDDTLDKIKCIEGIESNSVIVFIYISCGSFDIIDSLRAVWNCRTFPYDIIIIDDANAEKARLQINQFREKVNCRVLRNDVYRGFKYSIERALKDIESDYYAIIDADTIVTSMWIEKMMEVFSQDPSIGVVGTLSNKDLPGNVLEIEMLNNAVEMIFARKHQRVDYSDGKCIMLSKDVIDKIEIKSIERSDELDNDKEKCISLKDCGYVIEKAKNVYIYHKGENETGNIRLGDTEYRKICKRINTVKMCKGKRIGFLLPGRGGNGGSNSVCQEVLGMRRLGFDAYIINSINYYKEFSSNYPELKEFTLYFRRDSKTELYDIAQKTDIIIATIFSSVHIVSQLLNIKNTLKVGYYIQDDETLFFEKGSRLYKEAYQSYNLIPNMCAFAKTHWLVSQISQRHDVNVYKVKPSIDTRVYNPYLIKRKNISDKIKVVAMVRPRTPRRNPGGTIQVLQKLKYKYNDKVEVIIFGCQDSELKQFNEMLNFKYLNKGILKKGEVACLLAQADFFIDMSDYQAFGRTGLEGMCYGCVPVLPIRGGVYEYAQNNKNALLVDTKDIDSVIDALSKVIDDEKIITTLRKEAICTARNYDVISASWSELVVLSNLFRRKEACIGFGEQ